MTTSVINFNMFRNIRNNLSHCEFCFRNGHDVTTCTDPQLNTMQDILFDKKDEIYMKPNMTEDERKTDLSLFISRFVDESINNLRRWRCFSIRRCGYINNFIDNPTIWIKKIVEYVFNNDNHMNARSIFTDEFIRFNENDAANYFINNMENETITYLLDNLIAYSNNHNMIYNQTQKYNINIDEDCVQKDFAEICECGICYDEKTISEFVSLECKHKFCGDCFHNILKTNHSSQINCSMCRNPIKKIRVNNKDIKTNIEPFLLLQE